MAETTPSTEGAADGATEKAGLGWLLTDGVTDGSDEIASPTEGADDGAPDKAGLG